MSTECWTIGNNDYGQQGNGNKQIIPRLTKMNHLPNVHISDIIHGAKGSTYILCKDLIIVFGHNQYKQLGILNHIIQIIGIHWYSNINIPDDIIILIVNFIEFLNLPTFQTNPIFIQHYNIKLLSSGIQSRHKFILTTNDKLYGFGINNNNQIPLESKNKSDQWILHKHTEISYFKQHKITLIKIIGGYIFSLFLSNNGNIYHCGYATKQSIQPIKIIGAKQFIIDIACGYDHCLALNKNRQSYSWSGKNNSYGQLGRNDNDNYIPKLISYFIDNKIKINAIDCGHSHNLCIDINGNMYSFGNNDGFQCGIFNGTIHQKIIYEPRLNETMKGLIIISVKCGYYHNVICTKEKDYYLFGYNRYNQCLVYHTNQMFIKVPTKYNPSQDFTNLNCDVIAIYPGYQETRIVTKKI